MHRSDTDIILILAQIAELGNKGADRLNYARITQCVSSVLVDMVFLDSSESYMHKQKV